MVKTHSYFPGVVLALCLAGAFHCLGQESSTNSAPVSSDNASGPDKDVAAGMVRESYQDMDNGKLDEALREVDSALQLDSQSASAYELRGSIYIQKKLWDRAESDYRTASLIAPTTSVFKYKLAEIKYMQKAYDEARPRFAVLQNDENLGDLAAYKVFLCDLLGAHDERAFGELAVLNKADANPSCYYANAAWNLAHNKMKEANSWVNIAQQKFDSSRTAPYLASLINASDLHSPIATFTTKQGDQYNQTKVFVEDGGLRVLSNNRWTTIPFEQLPGDLSSFPVEVRNQIAAKRQTAPDADSDARKLNFTTKQGKKYDQVRVSIVGDGLHVLTADGWITVPFEQLQDDLSPFPAELRNQIVTKRQSAPGADDDTRTLSFTTKQGKEYDQVRISIVEAGLRVLTSDGWINLPFEQLPDDLSPFPAELQKQIAAKRKPVADAITKTEMLSFITKTGKHYDQVRATVQNDGLRILTSDGLVTIPYVQLPEDLSSFPAELRKQIVAKRQTATGTAENTTSWLSFTTKKGKQYDQVRVLIEDDGLQVLTSDGWITVPYAQLPDDLSSFPTEMQKQISAKQKANLAKSKAPSPATLAEKSGGQAKTNDPKRNAAFNVSSTQPE